jgi:alkylation response protein AidB-like acyl-CoA dehydrogenase
MYEYRAPRRDFQFVIHEVLEAEQTLTRLGHPDVNRELIDGILEEAARFSETVLSPLNWQGDWQDPTFAAGQVRTTPGFREAYQQFCRDGWPGRGADLAVGGQGLPAIAHIAVGEMLCSSAMAWRMASGLSEGAVLALTRHGSEELKSRYLGKLVSGEWTGTMCLSESQAGTDLGLLRTKAEPAGDGSFRVTGTKIFISWGEHDMADNIVHMVLARLPDAAPGTRGISLLLVPKLIDGKPNGVRCESIEHKMGIHGSPTCVMSFEQATGWLIGTPGGGLACMFTMMNHARLGVGLQGLGLSERALQASVHYAFERLQGRSASGPVMRDKPADPIAVHADVRRMLLTQKALTEGQRLLAYYTYQLEDIERLAPDPAEREHAGALVALLVPIVKSLLTDTAMETTSLAVQLHGGTGFIRGTGAEQYLRDAKIACIYEGTNGIQALDLLGRKVLGTGGASVKRMAEEIGKTLAGELPASLAPWAAAVKTGVEEWAALTRLVGDRVAKNPEELGAAAVDYLNFAGYVLVAWCWLKSAAVAEARLASGTSERAFYEGKLAAARLYFERLLPRIQGYAEAVRAGAATLPALTPAHFAA